MFFQRCSVTRRFCLVFCAVFLTVFDIVESQLESPCPEIFEYVTDENDDVYGRIKVSNLSGNDVVLNLELSVGNDVRGYNGNVELAYGKTKAVQEIVNGRPLQYKVFFPAWQVFPPRITKILVNGELICSGPPLDIKRVPVLTTINLQHSIKVNSLNLALTPDRPYHNHNNDLGRTPVNGNSNNINQNKPQSFESANKKENSWYFQFGDPNVPPQTYAGNPFLAFLTEKPQGSSNTNNNDNNLLPNIPINVEGKPLLSLFTTTEEPFISANPGKPSPTPKRPTRRPVLINTTPSPPPPVELPQLDIRGNTNEVCGKSLSTTFLISNGNPVAEGYFPWLVALYHIEQLNLKFNCGGSLVSRKHVITAAHCVKGEKKLIIEEFLIILGKYNIQRWTNDKDSLMLSVDKVDVHRDYRPLTADADIAVITLAEVVEFKRFIRPICLWEEGSDLKEVVGESGVVAGWGSDEKGNILTPEPKQVSLPIVSQEVCLRSNTGFADATSERTFCAGYRNGSGPCSGDSGGGFMMVRNGRWTLRGVVSVAIKDENRHCDLSQYLVFTDVSKFSDWLFSIINK